MKTDVPGMDAVIYEHLLLPYSLGGTAGMKPGHQPASPQPGGRECKPSSVYKKG